MITLKNMLYSASPDQFGILYKNGNISWYYCREQFHNVQNHVGTHKYTDKFVYSTKDVQEKINITNFIKEIERRLEIPEKQLTVISNTNVDNVLHFNIKWWTEQRIRSSLLTVLIRCGKKYNGKNFFAALDSSKYTKSKSARLMVREFLKGKNWYSGIGNMWVSADKKGKLIKKPEADNSLIKKIDRILNKNINKETQRLLLAQEIKKLLIASKK